MPGGIPGGTTPAMLGPAVIIRGMSAGERGKEGEQNMQLTLNVDGNNNNNNQ